MSNLDLEAVQAFLTAFIFFAVVIVLLVMAAEGRSLGPHEKGAIRQRELAD